MRPVSTRETCRYQSTPMQSLPHSHTLARPIGPAMIDGPAQFVPLPQRALGLASPADDFMDDAIDLHRLLVRNPAATFLYRADGWSMSGAASATGTSWWSTGR